MADEKNKKEEETPVEADAGLVSGEEIQATVIDDGLDLDIVDEFDESDFDEEFDDDFEEEIKGEYNLEDDKYGKEFEENFGHLIDPSKAKKKAAAAGGKVLKDSKGKPDAKDADKDAEKAVAKKAPAKKAPAKKAKKKPARKK